MGTTATDSSVASTWTGVGIIGPLYSCVGRGNPKTLVLFLASTQLHFRQRRAATWLASAGKKLRSGYLGACQLPSLSGSERT